MKIKALETLQGFAALIGTALTGIMGITIAQGFIWPSRFPINSRYYVALLIGVLLLIIGVLLDRLLRLGYFDEDPSGE